VRVRAKKEAEEAKEKKESKTRPNNVEWWQLFNDRTTEIVSE